MHWRFLSQHGETHKQMVRHEASKEGIHFFPPCNGRFQRNGMGTMMRQCVPVFQICSNSTHLPMQFAHTPRAADLLHNGACDQVNGRFSEQSHKSRMHRFTLRVRETLFGALAARISAAEPSAPFRASDCWDLCSDTRCTKHQKRTLRARIGGKCHFVAAAFLPISGWS